MNLRRGLVRLWVILSVLILTIAATFLAEPLWQAFKESGTTAVEIERDGRVSEIKMPSGYFELAESDKATVIMRVVYLVGINAPEAKECVSFEGELKSKLTGLAADDATTRPFLQRLLFNLHQSSDNVQWDYDHFDPSLIKSLFGKEYSDLGLEEFATALKKKLAKCRVTLVSSDPLPSPLEQLAQGAFVSAGTHSFSALYWPMTAVAILLAGMWALLLAGFWVASGFSSKR